MITTKYLTRRTGCKPVARRHQAASLSYAALLLALAVSANAQGPNVMVVNPTSRPVPVNITSGAVTVTGGGDASAANQTATQANAGSDAAKAQAVQGVTGGKAVPVSGTFWQATQPVSMASVPSHAVTNAGTFAVQVTTSAGASTLASGQVALSTSAAQVKASDATRRQILVRNIDPVISIYVGGTGVTSATGMLLKAGESMTSHSTAAIYAVAASGTPTAAYFDEHD